MEPEMGEGEEVGPVTCQTNDEKSLEPLKSKPLVLGSVMGTTGPSSRPEQARKLTGFQEEDNWASHSLSGRKWPPLVIFDSKQCSGGSIE